MNHHARTTAVSGGIVASGALLLLVAQGCGSSGGATGSHGDASAPDTSGTMNTDGGPGVDGGAGAADAANDSETSTDGSSMDARTDGATAPLPVLMGVDANGDPAFTTATGLSAQVVRVYLPGGDSVPTSVANAHLDTYYAAGEAVVYSIKADQSPDSQATNQSNLSALATDIKSKGYASKTWIALHHEPYPELTGAAFQTMYTTYAPSVRAAGVRCGVIYQTYPLYHGDSTYAPDYTSGILADVDFIGIDVYPDSTPGGYATGILSVISPFTTYANQNGKPFQIDEVAVDSTVTGTQAAQAAWLGGLANLGAAAELVMYYEGAPGGFPDLVIENNPAAVTEWKALYQTLTTR
jgi:hypothetical protein